jgi:hypothetical protein
VAIGQLEPLYRYLKLTNGKDPLEAMVHDIEKLAKGRYIENVSEGIHQVVESSTINSEIRAELEKLFDQPEPFYQVSYQALGGRMYITINRVTKYASKTSLACILKEDDTVDILYIDSDPLMLFADSKPTIYGSISTILVMPDNSIKNGFLRCETSLCNLGEDLYIKWDFRLSRTKPFYLAINKVWEIEPKGSSINELKWDSAWTR